MNKALENCALLLSSFTWKMVLLCSSKLEGRPICCRLSDKVCCSNQVTFVLCYFYTLLL